MLQAHVTPPLLALVAAVHLAELAACAAIIYFTPSRPTGWQTIEPSWMHWGAFFGAWIFTSLLTLVWLFVGTARPDPEEQMLAVLLMILGFGGLGVLCGFQIAYMRRASLRWRGMTIRQRQGSKDVSYDMAQFDLFRHSWDGSHHLRFQTGQKLKLDPFTRNAELFISTVYGRAKHRAYRSWRTISSPAAQPRRWWQLPTLKFSAASHFYAIVLPLLEDYWQAEEILRSASSEEDGSPIYSRARYLAFRHAGTAVLALHRFAEIVASNPPGKLKHLKGDPGGVRDWMAALQEESSLLDGIADALTKARSDRKNPVCIYRDEQILTVDRGRGAGKYGEEEFGGERIWAMMPGEKLPLTVLIAPVVHAWFHELDIPLPKSE